MKEVKLDSGATLRMTMASFSEGHGLLKAFAKETEHSKIDAQDNVYNTIKNLFCRLVWSPGVEAALWECMKRSTYDKKPITPDLFEDEKVREDFIIVCSEVGAYNLLPFTKSLYAKYQPIIEKIKNSLG